VCLGDGHGKTLPATWIRRLADCFAEQFDGDVTVNQPFSGGYITRTHGQRNPWVQLELTRDETIPHEEKRRRVLSALTRFCDEVV
jgi:formiminoglutamase